jgi:AraC-like DNA-binding protein
MRLEFWLTFGMAFQDRNRINTGSYTSPYSGWGQEFLPLGVLPDYSGMVLHESGYQRRNGPWNFPNMFSQFWRLIYDYQSGHQVVLPDKTVALGPDRIVVVPSHLRFHCQGREPLPTFWLHFNCSRRPAPTQTIPIEVAVEEIELTLMAKVSGLIQENKDGRMSGRIFGLSVALLQVVLSRREIAWLEEPPQGISRAVHHVEAHFPAPIYNDELAQVAGMSLRDFTRKFKQHLGVAPAQFTAQVRTREAAHMLLHTELSLDEIAARAGFPGRDYLTRVFTRLTAESPAQFRRTRRLGSHG